MKILQKKENMDLNWH